MNTIDQGLPVGTEAKESNAEESNAGTQQETTLRQWIKPDFQRVALNDALTSGDAVGGPDIGTFAS